MLFSVRRFKTKEIGGKEIMEIFQGWNAYSKWANSLKLRRSVLRDINKENARDKNKTSGISEEDF